MIFLPSFIKTKSTPSSPQELPVSLTLYPFSVRTFATPNSNPRPSIPLHHSCCFRNSSEAFRLFRNSQRLNFRKISFSSGLPLFDSEDFRRFGLLEEVSYIALITSNARTIDATICEVCITGMIPETKPRRHCVLGAAFSASDTFSKRAESFSESVAPPGLEILLILVSTNRPLLTEL